MQRVRSRDEEARESDTRNDDQWGGKSRLPERETGRYRSGRLVFERGWDAWWIRDAVDQIAKPTLLD